MKICNRKTVYIFDCNENRKQAENLLFGMKLPFSGLLNKPLLIVNATKAKKHCLDLYFHGLVNQFTQFDVKDVINIPLTNTGEVDNVRIKYTLRYVKVNGYTYWGYCDGLYNWGKKVNGLYRNVACNLSDLKNGNIFTMLRTERTRL